MEKRILIVDDEPDICEILRFNLEMEGYEVEVAEGPVPLASISTFPNRERASSGVAPIPPSHPSVEQGTILPSPQDRAISSRSSQKRPCPPQSPARPKGTLWLSLSAAELNLHQAQATERTPDLRLPQGEKTLPDLILLDVMMTPKSGFEWAKELKSDPRTASIPIIFCTAKTLEEDLLQGFALGSDDYICKPFRISEVKARVKAVLKRVTGPSPQPGPSPHPATVASLCRTGHYSPLTAGQSDIKSLFAEAPLFAPIANAQLAIAPNGEGVDSTHPITGMDSRHTIVYTPSPLGEPEGAGLFLDLDCKECFIDGQEVVLTKLEFEVLALLLSKPGQVFSREKILRTVWPSDTIVLDRTVDVNITRIRKKIGRYGEYLRTKFGYGYMFSA